MATTLNLLSPTRTELCKLPEQDKFALTLLVVGGELKFFGFLRRWVIVDVLIMLIVSTPYQICIKKGA